VVRLKAQVDTRGDRPHDVPDVVCVGESMLTVSHRSGRLRPGDGCALHAAGAESNAAMYLAALGHRAAWASRVGTDPLGEALLADIAAAGVDTSMVERVDGLPTGVMFKERRHGATSVHYYRAGSAAASMGAAFARRLEMAGNVLLLSGITPALSPSCSELIEELLGLATERGVRIVFDVNYRPRLWGDGAAETLRDIARRADVVLVGADEARALWAEDRPDHLHDLLVRGEGVLVVKNGGIDATAVGPAGRFCVPARRVPVVDAVGAGDAFAAGWISGTLRGLPIDQRLQLAHLVARSALAAVSDVGTLPDASEICQELGIPMDTWITSSTRISTCP
jgi:2-dehydro-3-deoxygluconokinase